MPARPRPQAHRHASTQQAFGRFFVDLDARGAARWPTASSPSRPDVGTSTNLGGWINKAGIWNPGDRIDWFADDTDTLVRWRESDHGRHIELGIAEVNLVGLLGELGRDVVARRPAAAAGGHDLRPVRGAGARAVVVRHLRGRPVDPRRHAVRRHARPRGRRAPVGDHAVIGIEQPGCVAYEPAFGQDFEWCFLHALSQLGKPGRHERATSGCRTRPIDQSLHTGTREEALAGGYKLRAHDAPQVVIAVMGALVPEALAAADDCRGGGRVEVVCITSADLLFRSFQARSGLGDGDPDTLERLFRRARADRLAARRPPAHARVPGRSPITCLGVQRFGQAGDIAELYEHHQIDAESVVGAALDLLG